MKFSTLSVILGAVYGALNLYALLQPAAFTASARRFARSQAWGYFLMPLGTLWFLFNLNNESISDFAAYKNLMLLGFGGVGLGTCFFVRDYLAVRGLSVVLLLLAWFTLNFARWSNSPWHVIVSAWCYVWIIAGMWFTISPWRLRDYLLWLTASPQRLKIQSGIRLGFAALIIVLGLIAF
jgi:hypothetical protein